MDYIKEIFERCTMDKVSTYLLCGAEACESSAEGYEERLKNIRTKINAWIKSQFPEFEDFDNQSSHLRSLTTELENVYFQIGLQAGVMLAVEAMGKTECTST